MAHSNWKCPIEIKLKGPFDTLRKKLSQSLKVRTKVKLFATDRQRHVHKSQKNLNTSEFYPEVNIN